MNKLLAAVVILVIVVGGAAPARAGRDVKGALKQVLGNKPGQLGPAFAGVVMGTTKAKGLPSDFDARGTAFATKYGVQLQSITAPYGDEVLGAYADLGGKGALAAVTAVWGAPTDKAGQIWLDAADHTCAEIAGDDSTVTFHRCQPIAELVGADKDRFGFEPYPLLGTSLAKLKAKLGDAITAGTGRPDGGKATEVAWELETVPPPGAESAMVEAIVDGSSDTIERVQLATGVEAKDAMAAAITKKLGVKPVADGGDQTWTTPSLHVRMHELHGAEHSVLFVSVSK